jgi:hypothetical protein
LAGITVSSMISWPPMPVKVIEPLATAPGCSSTWPPLIVTSMVVPPSTT